MDKTLVPQTLSVPMGWQSLVFRNGLEKTSWKGGARLRARPGMSLETLPDAVKVTGLRVGQGARSRR